jgi:hypothetical protein
MGNWTKQNFLQRRNSNGKKKKKTKTHEKMLTISSHKEVQIKTTLRVHLTPPWIVIIKNTSNNRCWWRCGEKGTLIHCWWEFKILQPLWKKNWRLRKSLHLDLSYDPATPLLGISQKGCDTGYSRGTCTPMFIAALFTSQVMETAKMPHYWQMD